MINIILFIVNVSLTICYILWKTKIDIWTENSPTKYTINWDLDKLTVPSKWKTEIADVSKLWAEQFKDKIDREILDEINKEMKELKK